MTIIPSLFLVMTTFSYTRCIYLWFTLHDRHIIPWLQERLIIYVHFFWSCPPSLRFPPLYDHNRLVQYLFSHDRSVVPYPLIKSFQIFHSLFFSAITALQSYLLRKCPYLWFPLLFSHDRFVVARLQKMPRSILKQETLVPTFSTRTWNFSS